MTFLRIPPVTHFRIRLTEWRRSWRLSTILIVVLGTTLFLNEVQRISAQWQGHRERQAQLYQAQANGMKLDRVIELLTRPSIGSDRQQYASRQRKAHPDAQR